MKKSYLILIIGLIVLALALSGFSLYKSNRVSKLAYIELSKVFSGFEMTKEYKKKLEAVVSSRKAITDSIEFGLKAKALKIGSSSNATDTQLYAYEGEKQLYLQKRKQFEEDNMAMKQQYDGEIYKQLNQYVKEYGDKHGYAYIFGAEGSGVLMYANQGNNISDDLLKYINERYNGGQK
jgi:outer membrane protein